MNRSRPIGALGGGGWEAGQAGPLPGASVPAKSNQRDKVLADMYEMFLDSMEAEIIQSVVQMCGYKRNKSMETLLEMCGGKNSSNKIPPQSPQSARNLLEDECKPPSSFQPPSALASNSEIPQSLSAGAPRNYSSSGTKPQPSPNIYFPTKKNKSTDPFANDKMAKVRWYIENKYKIMVIMRGCPGSGKSYLAEGLILAYGGNPKDYVFSTDDYFMKNNGYLFQPVALHEAHQWNQTRVLGKVREGQSPIIIDNTNTQLWEMTVYASMAINYGYAIEILEPETAWFTKLDELTKRNLHKVPRDKIRGMLDRYEFGITVEGLIKSTGAKYSKPLPQAAGHSLVDQALGNENQELSRGTNNTTGAARREQSFQNLNFTNFSPTSNFSTGPRLRDTTNSKPPDSHHSFSMGGGFYFGPNASNLGPNSLQTAPIKQDTRVQGLYNVTNPSKKSEENTLQPFHGTFKTRFVPLKTKGFASSAGVVETSGDILTSDISSSPINSLELNSPLSTDLHIDDPSILEAVEKKNTVLNLETKKDHQDSPTNIPMLDSEHISIGNPSMLDSEDISIGNSIVSSFLKLGTNESKDLTPNLHLRDVFEFKAESKSDQNTSDDLSLSPNDVVSKETKRVEASSSINWMGTADWNVTEKTTTDSSVQLRSAASFDGWMGTADWDMGSTNNNAKASQQSPLPKPAREFNLKNIQDYCQSVKDINAASPSEASGWSFCDNNTVSWQPIDKIQEETLKKEKSLSPQRSLSNFQRLRFKKCDVQEKGTNTHHADFSALSNISSNTLVEGVTVINAHDRDINEGKIFSDFKVSLKLMLDKGTLTENDFEVAMIKENKQEKIKELARLFPNRAPASLKELLKQGNWDVNYVSNLLLDDTDNDTFSPSFASDGNIDTDSDEESTQEPADEHNEGMELSSVEPAPGSDSNPTGPTAQELAEEVKRHLEKSIDFSERCYSPHLLAIKNLRRGIREGAIPKTNSPVSEEATASSARLTEFKETSPEPCQVMSESSDGDESSETLEFVVGQDFIQQLADKFGGSCNAANISPVVKFPVDLARQIHDVIFTTNVLDEEDDDGDFAMKLQCEEDEKIAKQLYGEMLSGVAQQTPSSPPQLREIMDMELAQAIYKADVDSLTQNSQETMANILAKRLLEDNYSQVDKRTLHDIFASCNYSFEDTVKTLQEALSNDNEVFSDKGRALREQELFNQAKQASMQERLQDLSSAHTENSQYAQVEYKDVEDSIENENPWELSDPKAYANKYREKADQYLKERDEMYRKANDAFRRKQRSVAAYYARLGELNGKKFHHANAMAAASLAAVHTNAHSSDTLDLHSYKVVEAVIVFDMFIDYQIRVLLERGLHQECLNVITGRGSHSVNGKPKIKPAVLNRARKRNLRYQTLQNPGVIRVWVTADSRPSHEIPD